MTNATHGCSAVFQSLGGRERVPARPAACRAAVPRSRAYRSATTSKRHGPAGVRPGRRQQAQQHARHGRVDVRLEEPQPDGRRQHGVDRQRCARPSHSSTATRPARRRPGPEGADDAGAVDDRDDQHGADVVGDGQRQQQHLQPVGDAGPSRVRKPTTKAMSVAIGTPQPCVPGRPHRPSR